MIDFRGWQRTSLLDFPGHVATVFFTAGCNFRCPMCHNADLVLRPASLPSTSSDEAFQFLRRRAGKVTGVVVTGGEPTLQTGLASFLEAVRGQGYATKLDTNGYRPDILGALLDDGLVDMVAMDVKGPPAKYALLSGVADIEVARIARSVALLAEAEVHAELRTTVVPGMLDEDDIRSVTQWLDDITGGSHVSYVLQQFRPVGTLDPALMKIQPYSGVKLREIAERASRPGLDISVRGV
ncbi:MAG: anaerobic ribonucleoside-triphosphate reductase activating protein [Anaerolineae bacterium]